MATQRLCSFRKADAENGDGSGEDKKEDSKAPFLAKDRNSIALLLFLYVLQGIPLGLAIGVPMILQAKKIGYRQQALFSLVSWPFSIKLLWAPVVDSLYSHRFGRRKSWLVPMQYAIGVCMVLLSYVMNRLMGEEGEPPNVPILTAFFFLLSFLAATKDIAVDGWALTMLSRENVGYASTCNTVGQTAGFFLGNSIFIALESKDFCNMYLRWEPQETGIITLPTFLFFCGIVFVFLTTGIWWFKRERKEEHEEREMHNVMSSYKKLMSCLKLPSVQAFALAILTSKIAFAAADNVTVLKLIEAGLPRERIALFCIPLALLQITLPWIINGVTAGPRPLDVFVGRAYPFQIVMGLVFALVVWWTSIVGDNGKFPLYYYIVTLFIFSMHQVAVYSMFVSIMAFHTRISDPAIGGTYMTLLNTISNLAATLPSTLALWLVDNASFKDCEGISDSTLDCDTLQELQACEAAGGHCVTHVDGYYVESIACAAIGVLWLLWQRKKLVQLQSLDESAWKASWHLKTVFTL